MKRRAFLPVLAGAMAARPAVGIGQPRIRTVGILDPGDPTPFLSEFRKGLSGLGYVEGKNIHLEVRLAESKNELLPRFAEELVRLKVDVIVARLTTALRAAMQATKDIPIVMVAAGGPVETGLIASLARPGGNVTGMSLGGVQLAGKRVQLIHESVPSLRRLALIANASDRFSDVIASSLTEAAGKLSVQTVSLNTSPQALNAAFTALPERPDAIHAMANLPANLVADLALRTRTPLFTTQRSGVEAGALISYGGRLEEQYRGAAVYVDKILKGTSPANLPVEEPSHFELTINMKTARTLGLSLSPALLARADETFE
jgi:putative ABC transport system substrate-binding protein